VTPHTKFRTAAILLFMFRLGACSIHEAHAQQTVTPPPDAPSAPTDAGPVATPAAGATPQQGEPPPPSVLPDTHLSALDDRLVAEPGKGITLRSRDDSYALTFRPRFQIRDTYTHTTKDLNELGLKTLRLVFSGNMLVPELKFFIQLALGSGDFEKDSSSPVYDAYIEYVGLRDFNVRLGQYLVPFDRARTIREYALEFVDRSAMVRELSLDRDVGLTFSSQDLFGLGHRLAYAAYIGSGDGKNRVGGQVLGPLVFARLGFRPFGAFDDDLEGDLRRENRWRVAVGVAGGYNLHAPRTQSTLGNTFTLGFADYVHAAADIVVKYGGFSIIAETLVRHALESGFDGKVNGMAAREWTRSGYGYLVQAGAMVSRCVQLTARWEQLFAEAGTDPTLIATAATQGRQLGAGINVYLNGHNLKLQGDYFYQWGVSTTSGQHQARVQLDASF
jgi:hypothetical protein